MLKKLRLDAIIAPTMRATMRPTMGPTWRIDPVRGDQDSFLSATTPPAVAGYPHVTAPMVLLSGLPVGLSFFASAWTVARQLALAGDHEPHTRLRQAPLFKPSAGT